MAKSNEPKSPGYSGGSFFASRRDALKEKMETERQDYIRRTQERAAQVQQKKNISDENQRKLMALTTQGVRNISAPKPGMSQAVAQQNQAQAAQAPQPGKMPSYGERLQQYAENSPLPKPIAKVIGALDVSKPFVALRQALGTQLPQEKNYAPVGGVSGILGSALSTYGSGVPVGGVQSNAMKAAERFAPNLLQGAGKLPAAARLGARIGASGAEGATQGVTQQLIMNPESSPEELANAAKLGAAFGGGGTLIGAGIAGGARGIGQAGLKGLLKPALQDMAVQDDAIRALARQNLDQQPLMLQEPRSVRSQRISEARANLATPDVIYNEGRPVVPGLPEPRDVAAARRAAARAIQTPDVILQQETSPRGLPAPRDTFSVNRQAAATQPLALPESTQQHLWERFDRMRQRPSEAYQGGPIYGKEQGAGEFEPSNAPLSLPEGTTRREAIRSEVHAELADIDDQLSSFERVRQAAIEDEYNALKAEAEGDYTKTPAGLIRDETGKVTSRFGAGSTKPQWLYEYGLNNNYRRPSQKVLREMAEKNVNEGFDRQGFKDSMDYDNVVGGLQQVRDTLQQEINPAPTRFEVPSASLKESLISVPGRPARMEALAKQRAAAAKKEADAQAKVQAKETAAANKAAAAEAKAKAKAEAERRAAALKTRNEGIITSVPRIAPKLKTKVGAKKPAEVIDIEGKSVPETAQAAAPEKVVAGGEMAKAAPEAPVKAEEPPKPVEPPKPAEPETVDVADVADEDLVQPEKNLFTTLFGKQGVGIAAGGSKKGNAVSSADVFVKNKIKEEGGIKDKITEVASTAHKGLVDRLAAMEKGGRNVQEAAYDVGRANGLANEIRGQEFVTPEGKVVGKGFEAIFDEIPRGHADDFIDYQTVIDAQSRVARGERVYDEKLKIPDPNDPTRMIELNSPEGLKIRREQLEAQMPWLPSITKEWNEFNKNLRQHYGINEGLINEAQNEAMEAARPNYIKMNRQFKKGELPQRTAFGRSNAQTFSGISAPIEHVSETGSARKIVDPRTTMLESIGAWTNNAMRNRVGQQLYENIKANPQAYKDIAEILPETSAAASKATIDEMNDIIAREGMDGLLQKLDQDWNIAFDTTHQAHSKGGNNISVMIKGHPVKIKIKDPELAAAFSGMNPQQLGLVMGIAKKGSDYIKRSATGLLAPAFGVKSGAMDITTGLVQAKGNRAAFLGNYAKALVSGLANEASKVPVLGKPLRGSRITQMARDYERRGSKFSAALKQQPEMKRQLGRLGRHPVLSGAMAKALPREILSGVFNTLESIPNVIANAPRIAAGAKELKNLGGQATQANIRRASQEARDVTVNYGRKGNWTDELESIFPYTNASVQAVSRAVKQFKEKPVQSTAMLTAVVGLPKVYEYMQFSDDPDYQKLTPREKYRNIIVGKTKDGKFIKVPVDPIYGMVGGAVLATLAKVKGDNPESWRGISDAISNSVLPPAASGALEGLTQNTTKSESKLGRSGVGLAGATSASPLIDVLSNRSFTGSKIVPASEDKGSPKYQSNEATTKLAKYIGQKTGLSPIKVDYLMRAYGGDPARFILPFTSTKGGGQAKDILLKNFIADPVFSTTLSEDYYDAVENYQTAEENFSGNGVPKPDWYDENLGAALRSKKKGSYYTRLKDVRDAKKEVSADKTLSKKEKADKTRELQGELNLIYADVIEQLKKSGYKLPNK